MTQLVNLLNDSAVSTNHAARSPRHAATTTVTRLSASSLPGYVGVSFANNNAATVVAAAAERAVDLGRLERMAAQGRCEPVQSQPSGAGQSGSGKPDWAKRVKRSQALREGAFVAAHTLNAGDGGGAPEGPNL